MTDTATHLGFSSYKPLEGEEYLNEAQLAHLEKILLAWQQSLGVPCRKVRNFPLTRYNPLPV